jgi:hypothetical protein
MNKYIAKLKFILERTNGIERLIVAISVVWFVFSNLIYFSTLNHWNHISLNVNCSNALFPEWTLIWVKATFQFDIAKPYVLDYPVQFEENFCVFGYKLTGHLIWVVTPIVLLYVLYKLILWVRNGFKKHT